MLRLARLGVHAVESVQQHLHGVVVDHAQRTSALDRALDQLVHILPPVRSVKPHLRGQRVVLVATQIGNLIDLRTERVGPPVVHRLELQVEHPRLVHLERDVRAEIPVELLGGLEATIVVANEASGDPPQLGEAGVGVTPADVGEHGPEVARLAQVLFLMETLGLGQRLGIGLLLLDDRDVQC